MKKTPSFRRTASSDLSAGLNVKELREYLVSVVPKYSNDLDLIKMTKVYSEIASRDCAEISKFKYALEQIMIILTSFLASSPSLPSVIVAEVHNYIGLIYEQQERRCCAINAFSKALWIQAADKESLPIRIALTEHRLGMAYGRRGNYSEATALLGKALAGYEKADVQKGCSNVTQAREELEKFRKHCSLNRI